MLENIANYQFDTDIFFCTERFLNGNFFTGINSFIVKHFADSVEYQTYGFLEKNKDTVIEEQVIFFFFD